MKFLITLFALLTLFNPIVAQTQPYPVCASQSSDPDGDGYGWENGTCLVTHVKPAHSDCSADYSSALVGTRVTQTDCEAPAVNPESSSVNTSDTCIDTEPLHDGWGWNGHSSCRVTSTPVPSTENTPALKTSTNETATPICIDTAPMNDGWGWNGTNSCRVSSVKTRSPQTPFQKHGKLSVCKGDNYMLCDQHGQPVQLTGMSSHGIHWSGWHTYNRGGCLTDESLDLLSQTWNTDVFRIAMYVKYGGYESSPEETIRHVNTIISELSDRGLYVIVDFHILVGTGISGNPLDYSDTAETFFRRIVQDNNHRQNVLYEIANEPQASDLTWGHIKQYGDRITKAIREEEHPENHAIIIVGTNSWSSFGMASNGNYLDIVNNPVIDSTGNLMYAFHFYANDISHIAKGYKDALSQAVHHIPVFVTEWGTQDASGGGVNDFGRAREYVQLMEQKKISWTMWNFSDAEESSAVWNNTSFCGQNHGWHDPGNLSPTGQFIKGIFDES